MEILKMKWKTILQNHIKIKSNEFIFHLVAGIRVVGSLFPMNNSPSCLNIYLITTRK